MTATGLKFTYTDLERLPDDRRRHELIDGDFCMTPAPGLRHQRSLASLFMLLRAFVVQHDFGEILLAPFDVILSPTDVVQPDLLYVTKANLIRLSERGLQGPPDLVIEIRSPSTESLDMDLKRKLYARFHVPEYWIVDPAAQRFEILRLSAEGYQLAGMYESGQVADPAIFPGLRLQISALFA